MGPKSNKAIKAVVMSNRMASHERKACMQHVHIEIIKLVGKYIKLQFTCTCEKAKRQTFYNRQSFVGCATVGCQVHVVQIG